MDTVTMATKGYVNDVGSGGSGAAGASIGVGDVAVGSARTCQTPPTTHQRRPHTGSDVTEGHCPTGRCGVQDLTPGGGMTAVANGDVRPPEVVHERKCYVVCPVRFMNNRARPGQAYVPTKFEHIANMVTHGLIIAPAILGLYWMLSLTTTTNQYWAALVYGAATLALFVTSTTFHTLSYHTERFSAMKEFFHIGDRAIIYIFIAASYTPWLILKDYHGWATFTLWLVWIMAAAGILYQYTFHEQYGAVFWYKWLETLFYLIIGVCPSLIIMCMKEKTGLYEMALGGAVYITGVVFFKCDGLIPFAHAIWHCFVFVGAVFHYVAVCKHLLGAKSYVDIEIES